MTIPLKDIEEQTPSKVSLMPDGLTDMLTRAEMVDLVSFLSSLGKKARWSVGKDKVARRWQAAQADAALESILAKTKNVLSLAGTDQAQPHAGPELFGNPRLVEPGRTDLARVVRDGRLDDGHAAARAALRHALDRALDRHLPTLAEQARDRARADIPERRVLEEVADRAQP